MFHSVACVQNKLELPIYNTTHKGIFLMCCNRRRVVVVAVVLGHVYVHIYVHMYL